MKGDLSQFNEHVGRTLYFIDFYEYAQYFIYRWNKDKS